MAPSNATSEGPRRGQTWTMLLWGAALLASLGSYVSLATVAFAFAGPGIVPLGVSAALGLLAWVVGLGFFVVSAARCRAVAHIALSLGAGMTCFFLLLVSGLVPRLAFGDFASKCEAGDRRACNVEAGMLQTGVTVRRDLPRARQLDQKACDMGEYLSCQRLLHRNPEPSDREPVCAAAIRYCEQDRRIYSNLCFLAQHDCGVARDRKP